MKGRGPRCDLAASWRKGLLTQGNKQRHIFMSGLRRIRIVTGQFQSLLCWLDSEGVWATASMLSQPSNEPGDTCG